MDLDVLMGERTQPAIGGNSRRGTLSLLQARAPTACRFRRALRGNLSIKYISGRKWMGDAVGNPVSMTTRGRRRGGRHEFCVCRPLGMQMTWEPKKRITAWERMKERGRGFRKESSEYGDKDEEDDMLYNKLIIRDNCEQTKSLVPTQLGQSIPKRNIHATRLCFAYGGIRKVCHMKNLQHFLQSINAERGEQTNNPFESTIEREMSKIFVT
ncbi:hypothetical protein CEXT_322361 [Caerostris extrusa]|uniref:Uncharacterized protein n=1 Tax=Caerostris extrusa TaxID=172846 RepID=A0AAV4SK54_CAEEX|nr:hypothetical protein CEXT_322361 [Caerostris extrusa]